MGVWESPEQTLLEPSCDSSLGLNHAPGLPELPATVPVRLSPGSNIAFLSQYTAWVEGELAGACQPAHASTLLGGSPASSLSCLLSQREGGREGRAEAGRAGGGERDGEGEERSCTNRDQQTETLARTPINCRSTGIF